MSDFVRLSASDFDREAIEADRLLTREERLALGPALYREAIAFTFAALRAEHPTATNDELNAILDQRLARTARCDLSD